MRTNAYKRVSMCACASAFDLCLCGHMATCLRACALCGLGWSTTLQGLHFEQMRRLQILEAPLEVYCSIKGGKVCMEDR